MAVGIGACQLRRDLGAIYRLADNIEMVLNHRQVKAREVKNFGDLRICQQTLQIWCVIVVFCELDQMSDSVTGGKLQQAKPVPPGFQTHGLAVNGNAVAKADVIGQIATVKVNLRRS